MGSDEMSLRVWGGPDHVFDENTQAQLDGKA